MTNIEKYNNVFKTVFNAEETDLSEKYTFKGVPQWDSVAHLSLITELEETFDIMFDAQDVLHFGSYLNGIKILEKYGIQI